METLLENDNYKDIIIGSFQFEQLKEMLSEQKYEARDTFKFAKQFENLVHEISSESKLQKRIS